MASYLAARARHVLQSSQKHYSSSPLLAEEHGRGCHEAGLIPCRRSTEYGSLGLQATHVTLDNNKVEAAAASFFASTQTLKRRRLQRLLVESRILHCLKPSMSGLLIHMCDDLLKPQ